MTKLLALSLLATLFVASGAVAQSADDIRRTLEENRPSPDIERFYSLRSNRPAWFSSGHTSAAYADLQQVVLHLNEQGLDPSRYTLPAGPPAPEVDVEITRTALRLGTDIHRGRIDVGTIYYGRVERDSAADLPVLLCRAVSDGSVDDFFRSLEPVHPAYARLKKALDRYLRMQEAGGWSPVRARATLHPGDTLDAVGALRSRLETEGDLSPVARAEENVFDGGVEQAVRRFQARHGLDIDGIVGPQTLTELHAPIEQRIQQIKLNLERWRHLGGEFGERYVQVNIPGFRLDVFEHDRVVMQMKVIVGKQTTRTPLFSTRITEVILAPYWYVPRSIEMNEIMPKVRRDPAYLSRHHMVRLDSGVLRQEPGPSNPLGRVKFTIPNPYGVGLHDTPEKHLFTRSTCAFSHGCMRAERPEDLALYLLRGTGWTRARLDATIERWTSTRIPVEEALPLRVLYWTAWVDEDGQVQFRRDVYGYDARLEIALNHNARLETAFKATTLTGKSR